jgi:hypothetical protein
MPVHVLCARNLTTVMYKIPTRLSKTIGWRDQFYICIVAYRLRQPAPPRYTCIQESVLLVLARYMASVVFDSCMTCKEHSLRVSGLWGAGVI